MTWKKLVKYYFDNGMYDEESVAGFVRKGSITAEDYQEITGKEYVPTDTTSK